MKLYISIAILVEIIILISKRNKNISYFNSITHLTNKTKYITSIKKELNKKSLFSKINTNIIQSKSKETQLNNYNYISSNQIHIRNIKYFCFYKVISFFKKERKLKNEILRYNKYNISKLSLLIKILFVKLKSIILKTKLNKRNTYSKLTKRADNMSLLNNKKDYLSKVTYYYVLFEKEITRNKNTFFCNLINNKRKILVKSNNSHIRNNSCNFYTNIYNKRYNSIKTNFYPFKKSRNRILNSKEKFNVTVFSESPDGTHCIYNGNINPIEFFINDTIKCNESNILCFEIIREIGYIKCFNITVNSSPLTNVKITLIYYNNLTKSEGMFQNADTVLSINFSNNFDSSKIENMNSMFKNCLKLSSLILNFNTSKVKNMKEMFRKLNNLVYLDVSSFDTSSVTDMNYMFSECKSLTSLVLRFDTSKVENMEDMFSHMYELNYIDILSFNTSNVKVMKGMFFMCKSLTSLTLNFDTSSVSNISSMFRVSNNLTYLDIFSFNNKSINTYTDFIDYNNTL